MRQKVEVKILFSDLSQSLNLMNVYMKGNTLIAVSGIEDTDNWGEAMCVRRDSAFVVINGDKELPVKHYIVNPGGRKLELEKNYSEVSSFEKIREIIGLEPLQIERIKDTNDFSSSVTGHRFFSGFDGDELEFDGGELEIEHEENMFRPV